MLISTGTLALYEFKVPTTPKILVLSSTSSQDSIQGLSVTPIPTFLALNNHDDDQTVRGQPQASLRRGRERSTSAYRSQVKGMHTREIITPDTDHHIANNCS